MNNNSKLGMFTSSGRLVPEPLSKYRTPFQRDRDRIIHSASFRRLKHKTQVFVNTEGDHYRTRITHSIEVAQIARSISSYLGLNDDLSETLSLAHDLGHTPFGHAGEDALNDCMSSYGGFDHNLQTLRIVMFLENKYLKFKGLNTLIGKNKFKNKINFKIYPSLEAQIAAISDDIAYNNHDIQDGIKANLFKLEELVEIDFFRNIYNKYKKKINKRNYKIAIHQIIRDSIDLMIKDLISNTKNNLTKLNIKNYKNLRFSKKLIVDFSENIKSSENEIRSFLRTKMYNNKEVLKMNNEGKKIINRLFNMIIRKPSKFIEKQDLKHNKYRTVSDFISGMTDRYAINLYNSNK